MIRKPEWVLWAVGLVLIGAWIAIMALWVRAEDLHMMQYYDSHEPSANWDAGVSGGFF